MIQAELPGLTPDGNRPARSLESFLADTLATARRNHADGVVSQVEYGRIGDLNFVRANWSGMATAGIREVIGKQQRGVAYIAARDGRVISVAIEGVVPGGEESLKAAEAAALTLATEAKH